MSRDNFAELQTQNQRLKQELFQLEQHQKNLEATLNQIVSAKAFKLWQGFNQLKRLSFTIIKNPKKISKGIKILLTQGPKGIIEKLKSQEIQQQQTLTINQQYQIWLKKHYPTSQELLNQRIKQKKFKYRPKISIITPVYNTPEKFLRECIESVLNQTYDNWELCLVDDASTNLQVKKIIKEYTKRNKRIKYKFRKTNGHICRASNDALKLATGESVGLLDHDDFLWPNALYEVVKLLNEKPHAQFIYSDEDKLAEDGKTHVDPFFKPDWSPDYLRSINYITHFAVLKKTLIDKIGGFRAGFEGTQDWDLFLRATRELEKITICHPLNSKSPIQHISTVLYSWRKSIKSAASKSGVGNKKYAYKNQKKVLADDLKNRQLRGTVKETDFLGLWNVEYQVKKNPLISIIIPTKDKYEYILRCLNSILNKTTYKNYELVIVDTGSTDKKVFKLYKQIKNQLSCHSRESGNPVTVLHWHKPFNFSAVCNFGAQKSRGEYLLFLNNDTEVISGQWLEVLVSYAQLPHIGAVGCKLLYPSNKIQHAGIIFNPKNRLNNLILPDHAFKNYEDNLDYQINNSCLYGAKNYLAVTAACLVIERAKFDQVGGFNEDFKIAFNDVGLCLKLNTVGLYNVCINWIKLLHHESLTIEKPGHHSRDKILFKNELFLLNQQWKNIVVKDPFLPCLY